MDNTVQEFILSDLKQMLSASANEAAIQTEDAHHQTWLVRIDQWLQCAEQESISREKITAVDPHVNMKKGPALKRLLKRVIRKAIYWFLQPVVVQQSGYNTINNSITNQLRDSICVLKDVVASQQKLICEMERRLENSTARIVSVENKMLSRFDTLDGQAGVFRSELSEQQVGFSNVKEQIDEVSTRIAQLEKSDDPVTDYMDYAKFEEKFRGSQEEIRSRIRRYLEYFSAGDKVLDLGCGRGEWLELLQSIGAKPIGVDLSRGNIALCRKKGLSVEQDDLFDYLERQEDCSLDGITAIQVVEHLSPVQLLRLTQLCYRKLKFGGHIIYETQNPSVVYTLTNNFFVDPTHIRPVHSAWAKYVLEDAGFSDVMLDYPQYAWVGDGSIPPLNSSDCDTANFNQRIEFLNNLLYGSTDYAAIGLKK